MDTTNLDLNKVDLDALKANLKEAEVTFGGRSGPQRLIDLAIENDLAIPLIGGEDFDPDAEPDEEEAGGNVVAEEYRKRYGSAQNCGDEMAAVFKDFVTSVDEAGKEFCDYRKLVEVADANKVDVERWGHLNIGMRRMNVGNVLRGKVKRGEKVVVGTRVWEAVAKDEASKDKVASKMG